MLTAQFSSKMLDGGEALRFAITLPSLLFPLSYFHPFFIPFSLNRSASLFTYSTKFQIRFDSRCLFAYTSHLIDGIYVSSSVSPIENPYRVTRSERARDKHTHFGVALGSLRSAGRRRKSAPHTASEPSAYRVRARSNSS